MANSSSGAYRRVGTASSESSFWRAARDGWLYAFAAASMLVLAALLYGVGVPQRRLADILLVLTIALAGFFWGRGAAFAAAIASMILFDAFFIRPSTAFSWPEWARLVEFGITGFGVGMLSDRMDEARRKARALAGNEQLQMLFLRTGAAILFAGVLAALMHVAGISPGRLMAFGPFYVAIVLVALLWGRGPGTAEAIAGIMLVDYFFVGRPAVFVVPTLREGALLLGFIPAGLVVGTLSDRMRAARRQARAFAESEGLQKTLLQVISHDLKTPLTTIMGTLHTLLERGLDLDEETRRELAAIAYDQAGRLDRLVTGILEMTRLETATGRVGREPCQLAEVVEDVLGQLREVLAQRECRFVASSSLPAVPADAVLLSHALANLVHNAAKFSPAASPIEVTAALSGGEIIVSVADRGVGIADADLDHVFEKFYSLRQSSARRHAMSGAGLGLAVAKGIVKAHGGRIWAEQRPGGGTIVRMSLPLS